MEWTTYLLPNGLRMRRSQDVLIALFSSWTAYDTFAGDGDRDGVSI